VLSIAKNPDKIFTASFNNSIKTGVANRPIARIILLLPNLLSLAKAQRCKACKGYIFLFALLSIYISVFEVN